jgi:Protein of unknown function (DUF4245)
VTTTERRRRAPGRSFTGLLWAMIPVLVVLVVLVVWQQAGTDAPRETLDPTGDVAYARSIAPVPFPDVVPPQGWQATSSQVDAPAGEKRSPVTLQIGFVTPAGKYAEVVVSDQAPVTVLRQVAQGATEDGTTPVGGAAWERYRSQRGEVVLVRRVGRATALVTGDASEADLVTAAASIR